MKNETDEKYFGINFYIKKDGRLLSSIEGRPTSEEQYKEIYCRLLLITEKVREVMQVNGWIPGDVLSDVKKVHDMTPEELEQATKDIHGIIGGC